jgi:hypothetical protein
MFAAITAKYIHATRLTSKTAPKIPTSSLDAFVLAALYGPTGFADRLSHRPGDPSGVTARV